MISENSNHERFFDAIPVQKMDLSEEFQGFRVG